VDLVRFIWSGASGPRSRLRPKPADRSFDLLLTGKIAGYQWDLELAGAPEADGIEVAYGERFSVRFVNQTGIAHPMHLHGHRFQLSGIGDQAFEGALRDTVMVRPRQRVRIAFDACDPGEWPLYYHIAYHLEAGMITKLRYV
jgi:FtsP/CotA-like multicopper oxidase with cupredoxin domain